MRTFLPMLGLAGALATGLFASDAQAFSPSSAPEAPSHVTLAAGGCGIGFHRGPYGGCRPNVVAPVPVYRAGPVYRGGPIYRPGPVYRGGYRAGYRAGYRRGRW